MIDDIIEGFGKAILKGVTRFLFDVLVEVLFLYRRNHPFHCDTWKEEATLELLHRRISLKMGDPYRIQHLDRYCLLASCCLAN
jgi:hypothetical protein